MSYQIRKASTILGFKVAGMGGVFPSECLQKEKLRLYEHICSLIINRGQVLSELSELANLLREIGDQV